MLISSTWPSPSYILMYVAFGERSLDTPGVVFLFDLYLDVKFNFNEAEGRENDVSMLNGHISL